MLRHLRAHDVLASFLAVTLTGLVLSGLLSFPTSCACGSSVPHPHALFELPGHHHDSDDHESHNHGQARDSEAIELDYPVTTRSYVQSSAPATANQVFLSLTGYLVFLSLSWTRWSIRPRQATLPPEWIDNIDDPPPRSRP